MSPTKPLLLFVYGTLMRQQRNHRYLDGARFLGPVRTAADYTLVLLGSFPALREDGISSVAGELYSVGPSILAALDQLELGQFSNSLVRVGKEGCQLLEVVVAQALGK